MLRKKRIIVHIGQKAGEQTADGELAKARKEIERKRLQREFETDLAVINVEIEELEAERKNLEKIRQLLKSELETSKMSEELVLRKRINVLNDDIMKICNQIYAKNLTKLEKTRGYYRP